MRGIAAANAQSIPTTLAVSVPLANEAQTVNAVWQGVRGSTVIIETPATLSAILD